MPAKNLTITALWTANNYTVTFDATGGDVTPTSKDVTYDSSYGDLPTPKGLDMALMGGTLRQTVAARRLSQLR